MSDHEKLVIPAGVRFENQADGLIIEHAGDIEIRGAPGGGLAGVTSTAGSVTLTGDVSVGTVNAAVHLNVNGDVNAGLLAAGAVNVTGGRLQAKAVKGAQSVNLGAAQVQLDIVMAPEVAIGPKAQGRVAVIEAQNDLAPNALKGGFNLKDFAEFTGQDPDKFLADRGLGGSADAVSPASEEDAEEDEEPEPAPEPEPEPELADEELESVDPDSASSSSASSASSASDAADDAGDGAEDSESDPLHYSLMENVDRIVACYEDDEQPPAVLELRQLLEQHEYQQVRDEITNLWNNLLKFHQKKGMRIQHQVTTTFNTINSIVRKMESA